jgi:hypothetical protein
MSGVSASNGMRQNKLIGLILLIVPSLFFIFFSYLLLFTRMGYSCDKNNPDNYSRYPDKRTCLDGLYYGYCPPRKMKSY